MSKESPKGLLSMIGPGTVVEGTIHAPHSIRIEGTLRGKLETTETVTVGPSGIVEADIIARSASIAGKIIGNLTAQDRVELEAIASLKGDLKTRDLVINEGATFQGTCIMSDADSTSV